MPLRDPEGYLIIPEDLSSASSPSVSSESSQPSTVVATYVSLQHRLSTLYGPLVYFFEHQLFTRSSYQFVSKYLLYPLLSGIISATFAYLRRRRHHH